MEPPREAFIRKVWREQGQALWNPATHGLGEPLKVEGLTFRIMTTRLPDARTVPSVECEGIVVEMSP
jgi:hypothetical protein